AKGGWVLLRDAVKRTLPEAAPKPGAFRKAAGDQPKQAKQAETEQAARADSEPQEGGSQE
ncbi:MAG: 50S ribosomal protein L3, partial [Methyloceanibacter sp.]